MHKNLYKDELLKNTILKEWMLIVINLQRHVLLIQINDQTLQSSCHNSRSQMGTKDTWDIQKEEV